MAVINKASKKQKIELLANPYKIDKNEDLGLETQEKIVRIIRDAIIAKQTSLREEFEIKGSALDV